MIEMPKNLSPRECEILIKISFSNNMKETNYYELCNEIGVAQTNPVLNKLLKILKECEILIITNEVGKKQFFTIKRKELRDLIDEQEFCNLWADYFKSYHIFEW